MKVKRGEIFMVDLDDECGKHIQEGERPVVIIQNDKGNKYSETTIVAPLTTKIKKSTLPTHCFIRRNEENGLRYNSMCLLEQLTTIDISDLATKIGCMSDEDLHKIDKALKVSLELN